MIIDTTNANATLLIEVGTEGHSTLSVKSKIKAIRKQFKKTVPHIQLIIVNNDAHTTVLIKSVVYS